MLRAPHGRSARNHVGMSKPNRLPLEDLQPIVRLDERSVQLVNVVFDDADVVRYLRSLEVAEDGGALSQEIERALRIGSLCLEKTARDAGLDYLEARTQHLVDQFEGAVAGLVDEAAQQLSSSDGTLVPRVQRMVEDVRGQLQKDLQAVRQVVDAGDPKSSLGQVLEQLRRLMDVDRTDSVPFLLKAQIQRSVSPQGELLANFRQVVEEVFAPVQKQVDALKADLAARQAVEVLTQSTPLKGFDFEDQLVPPLKALAQSLGAELAKTGDDNRPGDFVLDLAGSLAGEELRLVVEAKDTTAKFGVPKIKEALGKAMVERGAQVGILVCKTAEGLTLEVGEFFEGVAPQGKVFACTPAFLNLAVRMAVALHRLETRQQSRPEFDAHGVLDQVLSIRKLLDGMAEVRKQLTAIDKAGIAIGAAVEAHKKGVAAALLRIEELLAGAQE